MIVVMKPSATAQEIGEVIRRVEAAGFQVHSSKDEGHTVMAVVGSGVEAQRDGLMGLNGVENVFDIVPPYKLASREYRRTGTVVEVGGVKIGGPVPVLIAGPCAVESFDQLLATAEAVKAAGADGLLVEVHVKPEEALCDGKQALLPEDFRRLVGEIEGIAAAIGRPLRAAAKAPGMR